MKVINLKGCKKGDILISRHGAILRYVKPLKEEDYYDHEVEYVYLDGNLNKGSLGNGTRNDDGSVFKKNKMPLDHDIVEIIPLKIFKKLAEQL